MKLTDARENMGVIFDNFKDVAESNGLTDLQIDDMTKEQTAVYMGIEASQIDDAMFAVAKARLLRERQREKRQIAFDGLENQLVGGARRWLNDNYPNHEFVGNFRHNSATVSFEGRPAEDEL